MIRGHEIDPSDNAGCRARATAIKHTHCNQIYALSNSIGASTNGSSHMCPVSVAVVGAVSVVDGCETGNHAAVIFIVRRAYAGIDDVGSYTCSCGCVVISVIKRQISLINAIESPSGRGLSRGQTYLTVLFYELYEGFRGQSRSLLLIHAHRKALQRASISVAIGAITQVILRQPRRLLVNVGYAVFEHYDVLILNSLLRAPEFALVITIPLALDRRQDSHRNAQSDESKQNQTLLHCSPS